MELHKTEIASINDFRFLDKSPGSVHYILLHNRLLRSYLDYIENHFLPQLRRPSVFLFGEVVVRDTGKCIERYRVGRFKDALFVFANVKTGKMVQKKFFLDRDEANHVVSMASNHHHYRPIWYHMAGTGKMIASVHAAAIRNASIIIDTGGLDPNGEKEIVELGLKYGKEGKAIYVLTAFRDSFDSIGS